MLEPTLLWSFIAVCAVTLMVPGPDMLLVLSSTFANQRRGGIITSFGVCSGYLVHIVAAVLGFTAIILASATLFSLVKFIGAGYLIYLGFRAWHSNSALFLDRGEQDTSLNLFTQGFLGNALNPKAILFFMALIPQFVSPSLGNIALQVVILGVVDIGISLIWYISLVLLANRIRLVLTSRPKVVAWIDRAMGSLLVIIGVRLLFTKRPAT